MNANAILGIKGNGWDIDSEQDEHNEKTENYDRLQDLYLKEINKQNALHENKSLKEILNEEKMNTVIKNAIGFQPKSFGGLMTVINCLKGDVIFQMTGKMSIEADTSDNQLEVIVECDGGF